MRNFGTQGANRDAEPVSIIGWKAGIKWLMNLSVMLFAVNSQAEFFEAINCEDLANRATEYEMYLSCESMPSCVGKFASERSQLKSFVKERAKNLAKCEDNEKRSFLTTSIDPREESHPFLTREIFAQVEAEIAPIDVCKVAQMSLASITQLETNEELLVLEKQLLQQKSFQVFDAAISVVKSRKLQCYDKGLNLLSGFSEFEPELKRFPSFFLVEALKRLPAPEKTLKARSEMAVSFIERSLELNPQIIESSLSAVLSSREQAAAQKEFLKVAVENLNLPAAKHFASVSKYGNGISTQDFNSWVCAAEESRGPWSRLMMQDSLGVKLACQDSPRRPALSMKTK